jgi:hypothetical protein
LSGSHLCLALFLLCLPIARQSLDLRLYFIAQPSPAYNPEPRAHIVSNPDLFKIPQIAQNFFKGLTNPAGPVNVNFNQSGITEKQARSGDAAGAFVSRLSDSSSAAAQKRYGSTGEEILWPFNTRWKN